jgi:hypothetical protein
MAPHYDRHTDLAGEQATPRDGLGIGPDEEAMENAAEALREAEVEAVLPEIPDVSTLTPSDLDQMSIDELRAVANELDVPDRATIIERDELIAAIRPRL